MLNTESLTAEIMIRNNTYLSILAYFIKLSCPWYLRAVLYRVVLQPLLIGAFLLFIVIIALLPTFAHNTLHRSALPQTLFWPEILKEFEANFPTPEELAHHVEFWKAVFSQYTRRQIILHDNTYPQVIYAVVDLDSSPGIRVALRKYTRILLQIYRKEQAHRLEDLTSEENRVYELFADISEKGKFRKAARQRIRAQSGQRENFMKAIRRSGLYQEKFEQIFAQYGLPLELTRIPFVESFFKPRARSYAGAAGLWQFMPATARQYGLQVSRHVDERYDPFKAADSAARLLKSNYDTFQSWPLAITAYNHGPGGIQKAVDQVHTTDIGKIVVSYKGANFGFYSRNYYAQFLAAAYIMLDPDRYFGKIERLPALHDENKTPAKQ